MPSKTPRPARAGASRPARPAEEVVAGRRPILELLRAGGAIQHILIAKEAAGSGVLEEIRRLAERAAVPLRVVPRAEVVKLAEGANHQGVVALAGRFRYTSLEEILARPEPLVVFLDGVTDPHNLGSLLRSADAAGFVGVVVPAHRSAHVTPAVRRVSSGAAEVVPVARVTNLSRSLDEAKGAGLWLVGLDEKAEADIWSSDLLEAPLGLVLGSEEKGLSRNVRDRCDQVVAIPQAGRIGSLNVAVAGAVAMFEVARRRSADTL